MSTATYENDTAEYCDTHTVPRADCGCRWGADPVNAHHGQARMAYKLAAGYADRLMFVYGIGWHAWDGRRWLKDDRGEAKRAVLEVLRAALAASLGNKALRADVQRCESAAGVAGVLDLAAALEPFACTVGDLDEDPYLLNCANGTLDLHTMALRPHDPADRITKVTGAAYDPDAVGPTWEAFLARVLPETPVREFLQRYAGVGLSGRVLEHVLAILTGTGRNGKGVFDRGVAVALGDYASTADPELFMARENAHPTSEMDLLGVRWVVVSESDQGRRLAEATVKRLTGGDTIKARLMRQDFVQFNPSHTALLITNHLPKVSGDDPALWARLRVVPFDVVIPQAEQDTHLGEKLELEADAILAWVIAGWADYQARGGLAEPEGVIKATEAYQADSDAVGRFLADCCLINPLMWTSVSDLFDRWSRWAAEDGSDPSNKRAFGDALDKRGHPVTRGTGGKRIRKGLGLAAEGSDDEGEAW